MGSVRAGRPVRSPADDRVTQLAESPPPVGARKRVLHRDVLVRLAEPCDLDRGVELLPVGEVDGTSVAVKLDAALLRAAGDVEVRSETHDRAALELDDGDTEVGCLGRERLAGHRHPVGKDHGPEGGDAAGRAEHGGEDRERVHADVRERPDAVEGLRARVPALDPVPVHLCVRDANAADRARLHETPHRLLGFAHERDGRTRQPEAAFGRELDERTSDGVASRERLLAMDVLAGAQRGGRHLRVDGGNRQVDDRVDVRISEHVVERRIVDASEAIDERTAQRGVDVRGAGDADRRVGAHRVAVRAGDVAAPDDGDPERVRHALLPP